MAAADTTGNGVIEKRGERKRDPDALPRVMNAEGRFVVTGFIRFERAVADELLQSVDGATEPYECGHYGPTGSPLGDNTTPSCDDVAT